MTLIILTHLVAISVGACFGFAAAAVLMMGKIADLEQELEAERLSGGSR